MENEIVFLLTAALLFLFDLALLSTSKTDNKRKTRYGFYASVFGFGLIIVSYMMLLEGFISDDFSIVGVYSYSSSSLPILSKVYASWGGAGGSMLFLTFLLSIFYFSIRFLTWRKATRFNISACQVFSVVLLVFLAVCLLRNPCERLSVVPVEGRGLNPQLQTFWMFIHPPIVFAAYAFVVLAYTLTLASMKTGRELDTMKLFKGSTYAAWLLLTLGIALGGVWAYEVLGWGGYWAWDPVETASLLPWLFLTAYFFVSKLSKSKQSLTQEFMILITFASLIFLSALTRGGFTQSVHSYAVSAVGPLLLVFALGMITYFFYLKKNRRKPLFKLEVDKTSLLSRSSFIVFLALIFTALVCLIGLAFPNFSYNQWTFPFVMILVMALIGYSLDEKTHYVRLLLMVLIALVTGLILIIAFPAVNVLATLSMPLLILAFSALSYKVFKVLRRKSWQLFGRSLFNLAIIILLLGVFISTGAKNTSTLTNIKMKTPAEAMQIEVELTDILLLNSSALVYNEQLHEIISEYSTLIVDVTIQQFGKTFRGSLSASFYPNYGLVLRPLIITTETGDIYVHLEYTESLYNALVQALNGNSIIPVDISITLQTNPMIYLVWAGVTLMIIGIFVDFVGDLTGKRKAQDIKQINKNELLASPK
jgi:c-type cytochrome biogenesis protein CcmF